MKKILVCHLCLGFLRFAAGSCARAQEATNQIKSLTLQ